MNRHLIQSSAQLVVAGIRDAAKTAADAAVVGVTTIDLAEIDRALEKLEELRQQLVGYRTAILRDRAGVPLPPNEDDDHAGET